MKKILAAAILLMSAGSFAFADAPANYYSSCEGKTGQPLLQALYNKISSHTNIGYNGLWELYKVADIDENGRIIDIYSTKRWIPGTEQCGNMTSNIGTCYNREHSFPKSWFGAGTSTPMYSDAFHLYPTDGLVNSQRSNYPYGECANGVSKADYGGYKALGKLGTSTFPGYTGTVFEPDDEYKGDLARTYFYMATCYYNIIGTWNYSDAYMLNQTQYPAFSDWALALLLKWHRQDPVSEKELARQEVVYNAQGNRNPYIDHPELVEYIWGDKVGTIWTADALPDAAINMPLEGAVLDCGSVNVGSQSENELFVNCTSLTSAVTFTIGDVTFTADTPSTPDPGPNPEPDPTPDPNPDPNPDPEPVTTDYIMQWSDPTSITPAEGVEAITPPAAGAAYDVEDKSYVVGPVTVAFSKESGTNPRVWNGSGKYSLRLYNGSVSRFTTSEGRIVKITFTPASGSLSFTADDGTVSDDHKEWTGSTDDLTLNWTDKSYISSMTVYVQTGGTVTAVRGTVVPLSSSKTYEEDLTYVMLGIQNASTTGYANFTGTSEAGRNYVANAYGKQEYIQLRSTTNSTCQERCHSGVVSVSSLGDYIRAVHVAWNEETNATRELQVYGSNTPYTHPDDLYSASTQGTLLGTILRSDADSHGYGVLDNFEGDYKYIGLRSKNNALMIYSFTFEWEKSGDDEDEPAAPAFVVSPSSISADEANASTTITVTFAPTAAGTYTAPLTITSGAVSRTITLTGTGVAHLTALEAADVATDGFTARWVDIDNGAATYQLYVSCGDQLLEGYPVAVSSGACQHPVTDLYDETEYTYYLVRGDEQSNVVTVSTLAIMPELLVTVPEGFGGMSGDTPDDVYVHLKLVSEHGWRSEHVAVNICATKIDGDMEISIEEPFEVSADTKNWSHTVTMDTREDHVYVRLAGFTTGTFIKPLVVKAGRIPASSTEARLLDTGDSWQYVNDDILVHGSVGLPTGVEQPVIVTEWEAYCLDGELVVDNRTEKTLKAMIYTIDGYEVGAVDAASGLNKVKLPSGFYLIVSGDQARRVLVD